MSVPEAAGRLTVAAVMPLYNKRRTVVEAVESVLAQTRVPEEIVIVDDGSSDGSREVVRQRFADEPRVRLICHETNRGVSAARNTAIRATTAPLIAFLDGDDRWLPTKIERQAALMEERPEAMLVWVAAILCDESTGESVVEGDCVDRAKFVRGAFFNEDLLPACSGTMVRRAALEAVGLFDESLWCGEDTDLWLRIMLRFGFEHIGEPLVWMRRGRQDSLVKMKRMFEGSDRYFAKHRTTFGRGPVGQCIWRRAYGGILRKQAFWCFRHNAGPTGFAKLAKALAVWPLFDPRWTLRTLLDYVLGRSLYGCCIGAFRAALRPLSRHGRRDIAPNAAVQATSEPDADGRAG